MEYATGVSLTSQNGGGVVSGGNEGEIAATAAAGSDDGFALDQEVFATGPLVQRRQCRPRETMKTHHYSALTPLSSNRESNMQAFSPDSFERRDCPNGHENKSRREILSGASYIDGREQATGAAWHMRERLEMVAASSDQT
jgi:hypothetical protein